ncbi:MAG: S41 family peptidase [Candidatus Eisenbacteria bacterium]
MPDDERRSVIDRAWTELRDGFYQATLHLANWNQVRERTRGRLEGVRTRGELERLLLEMSGALNASHLGVGTPPAEPAGLLGISVYSERGRVRVRDVLPGGPAAALGIEAGDQIFSIGRTVVDGTAALEVAAPLGVSEPVDVVWFGEKGEERRGAVRPASSGEIRDLHFAREARIRSGRVRKEAKGKVSYVALRTIDRTSLDALRREVELFQPEGEALILDLRDNVGGDLPEEFLRELDRTPRVVRQPRGEVRRAVPAPLTRVPLAVLIGPRTGSAAEVVARGLAEGGRAILVGETTAGSVIGADEIELGMGLRFRIPRVGWYTLQGENLEGRGVSPDVQVETSPFGAELGTGDSIGTPGRPGEHVREKAPGFDSRDLVLERAIELLEDRLRRR